MKRRKGKYGLIAIMKLSSSPFSLQIRCSLNPKNQPMEHLPLCAIPLNVLWIWMRWFLHTLSGVLSTKLIPVHLPSSTFLMNRARGMATSLQFHETVVGDQLWKQMAQMLRHMLQIEMLQTAVAGTMKQNQNYHHFCLEKRPVTMVFPLFSLLQSIFFHHCIKKTAKIIRHTENFRSFLERSEKLCPR